MLTIGPDTKGQILHQTFVPSLACNSFRGSCFSRGDPAECGLREAAVGTQSSPSLGTSRAAFRLSGTSPRQGDCEFRRRRLFRVLASCMPRSGRPSPRRFFKAPCGAGKPKVSALEEARCPARRRRATYLFRQLLWCDAAIQSLSESPAPGRISRQTTRRAGQSFAMATLREGAYAAPACRDRACADRAIGADRHQGLCGVRRALFL
jgi:hypothetical protein